VACDRRGSDRLTRGKEVPGRRRVPDGIGSESISSKHRQAVDVLAAMIVDWWRREARNAAGDTTTDG
jgi:hypothetical protein